MITMRVMVVTLLESFHTYVDRLSVLATLWRPCA